MNLAAFALATILRILPHPSPAWHEPQADYEARAATIANAAVLAARHDRDLLVAELVVVDFESSFNPAVHAGTKRGDGGKALCLAQLHRNGHDAATWEALAGLDADSTARCLGAEANALRWALMRCQRLDSKYGWPEAIVLYGTGRTCRADETGNRKGFEARADEWRRLRS